MFAKPMFAQLRITVFSNAGNSTTCLALHELPLAAVPRRPANVIDCADSSVTLIIIMTIIIITIIAVISVAPYLTYRDEHTALYEINKKK